jgi:putative transcriptional regulator
MKFSTAPGILIAVPQLDDPNFHRSVVLMVEHNEKGALGLIVNLEVDHPSAAVADELGLTWPGRPNDRLRRGGPVEPQSLWMLHDDGWAFSETMRVVPGVSVSRSREALTRMCEAREQRLVFLVGYAGWGAGQLEREIAQGAWLSSRASAELVFEWPPDEVWTRALAAMGIDPAHLVEAAGEIQ